MVRELVTPVRETEAALPALYTYSDATAPGAAEIMATEGLSTLPVVDRKSLQVRGAISLSDLLRGRTRSIERVKERFRLVGYSLPDRRSVSDREPYEP